MPTGTETMRYLRHDQLPPGRKATYACLVATERLNKAETKYVRLAIGGNLINYPAKSAPQQQIFPLSRSCSTVSSPLVVPGLQLSTAKFSTSGTPTNRKECMRIAIASFPQAIIDQYHLLDLVHKGVVLVEISRGMYGLPQADILAHEQLVKHMVTHGYAPCTRNPDL
jgi:hypothetical protein